MMTTAGLHGFTSGMTSDSFNNLVFSAKVLSFDFLSAIDIEYDQIDSEDYEYDN